LRVHALERRLRDAGGSTCPDPVIEIERIDSVYDLPPAEEPPPPCELCGQHHVTLLCEVVIHSREDLQVYRDLGYDPGS
jgi:hypothetical protein